MPIGGNKNLQQIPGSLEDHVQAQKRTELLFLNNFEALCMQEVKAKAELLTTWLNIERMPLMHTEALSKE